MRHLEVIRRLYRNRVAGRKPYQAPTLNEEESKLLHTLKTDGIALLPDFFSPAQVNTMLDAVKNKIDSKPESEWRQIAEKNRQKEFSWGVEDTDKTMCWADPELSDLRVWHAEYLHPDIASFGNNKMFQRIAENYLHQPVSLRFTLCNHTRFIENNRGSGGGWHRDNNYINSFKALVYLVDSNEQNGCFQYLKGSFSYSHHIFKTPTPDKYQFTHDEVLDMIGHDESRIFNVVGKAGTVVIFDTNGVHRGKPMEKGDRYALTNYYNH
jgi:hypothetical protein